MWVKRTEVEEARWHEITGREARSRGLPSAIVVLVATLCGTAGGVFSFRFGAIIPTPHSGSLPARLIVCLFFGPFMALFIYRRIVRNEVSKSLQRTICAKCGSAGEQPAGTDCVCGGQYVPQSTMKWVDDSVKTA